MSNNINVSTGFSFNTADAADNRTLKPDLAGRDGIPLVFRHEGLVCYVISETKWYQLRGGVDNVNWVDITSGGGGGDSIYTSNDTFTGSRTATLDAAKDLSFNITGTGSFKVQDSGTDFFSLQDTRQLVFDGDSHPNLFKIDGTNNNIGIGDDSTTSSFIKTGGVHKLSGAGSTGINFNATYETPDGAGGNFMGICQQDTYEIVGNSTIFGVLNMCINTPTVNIEAGSSVGFITNLYIESAPPVGIAQYNMIIEEGDVAIQSEMFIGTGSTNFSNTKIHLGDEGTAIFNKQQQTGAFEIYSDTTTDLFYADYTGAGSIGIGNNTPSRKLHITGQTLIDYTPDINPGLEIVATAANARTLQIKNSNTNAVHSLRISTTNDGVLSVTKDDGTVVFEANAQTNTVELDEDGVFEIGNDTNLYRSNPDELTTDDSLVIAGSMFARYIGTTGVKSETLAGNQNDYDIEDVFWLKLDPNGAAINITGLNNGVEGREVMITHVGTTGTITLINDSGSSAVGNRMFIPAGAGSIQMKETKLMKYNAADQHWYCKAFA